MKKLLLTIFFLLFPAIVWAAFVPVSPTRNTTTKVGFWPVINDSFGIGTSTPSAKFSVASTTPDALAPSFISNDIGAAVGDWVNGDTIQYRAYAQRQTNGITWYTYATTSDTETITDSLTQSPVVDTAGTNITVLTSIYFCRNYNGAGFVEHALVGNSDSVTDLQGSIGGVAWSTGCNPYPSPYEISDFFGYSAPTGLLYSAYLTNGFVYFGDRVGIGSTTAYSRFAIHANPTDAYLATLFSIASSTGTFSTSTLFAILANGNVGIGTTTPYAALSVVGASGVVADHYIATSTATSTLTGGLDAVRVCLTGTTTCLAPSTGTVSTGLTGEFPWYAANGTTLSASSSASLTIGRIFATSTATSTIAGGFTVSSPAFVVQKATGNIGINILNPSARFTIDNSSSGSFTLDSSSALAISTGVSGGLLAFTSSGNLGTGTSTPYARLSVEESSTVVPFVVGDQGTSTPLLWVNSRGFVGIATTSLQALLDIGASTVARPSLYIEPGPAPTATTTGFVWMDSKQNQFVLSNGNNLYQGGGMYRAQTDDVINSATLTSALSSTYTGTTTIFANTLKVGQRFTVWGAGYYSTPALNTDTVTIQTSVASTTGTMVISTVTTGAFPASATNLPFDFNMNCTVRATGVSGTIVCDGDFKYTTALSGVAKTSNSLSTIGTIKLDTTVNEWLDVKANWSVAAGGQTATVQEATIDF